MSIFANIWHWLQGIFDSLEKEWHKLEPAVKNALTWASGAVNVITTNLDATPQFVLDLIEKNFPGIDLEKVKAGLQEVAKDIAGAQTVPGDDIYTTITNLQKYFAGLGDKKWEIEAATLSQKLASIFSPDGTPNATIVTFAEYVYQRWIKKS